MQGQVRVAGAGRRFAKIRQLAYEHKTALLGRFDMDKVYAHDTATYMFLLLGIPPKFFLVFSGLIDVGRFPTERHLNPHDFPVSKLFMMNGLS